MTKAELLAMLEDFKDDDEIVIWEWDGTHSRFWHAECTCQNMPNEYNSLADGRHFFALHKSIAALK